MFARCVGLEVQRADALSIPQYRVCHFLKAHNIDVVLDVGANDGGYASSLFDSGFDGTVYSFEPLPSAWSALQARAAGNSKWRVPPAVALSDRAGVAKFYISKNQVSSSLLSMTIVHEEAAPDSSIRECISVETQRLDQFIEAIEPKRSFLKIDVQGAERLVLDGAQEALRSRIFGVQLEMSLTELYSGQTLSHELHQELARLGFWIWDIIPGFRDTKTMRLLQYDGIYFR